MLELLCLCDSEASIRLLFTHQSSKKGTSKKNCHRLYPTYHDAQLLEGLKNPCGIIKKLFFIARSSLGRKQVLVLTLDFYL